MGSAMALLLNKCVWLSRYILRELVHLSYLRALIFFIHLFHYNNFIVRFFIPSLGSNFLFFFFLEYFWLTSIGVRALRWGFFFNRRRLIQVAHFVVQVSHILLMLVLISRRFRTFLVRHFRSVKYLISFILIHCVLIVILSFALSRTLKTVSFLRWIQLVTATLSSALVEIAAFAQA